LLPAVAAAPPQRLEFQSRAATNPRPQTRLPPGLHQEQGQDQKGAPKPGPGVSNGNR